MAEHFVLPPNWTWYILGYFFIAGLTGGFFVLSTMLRIWGSERDQQTARWGFMIAFPLAVMCGILLTVDLGQPLRFWHMMVNTTPGSEGLSLKAWSPISLGTWVLLVYSIFAFVMFLEAAGWVGSFSRSISAVIGVIGSLLALFIASYTGVVLSVSNQPVWSDTWSLGALFLVSGLSGSAALLAWRAHARQDAPQTASGLMRAEGYFAILELILIVIFLATLAGAGTLPITLAMPWGILWILVVLSIIPAIMGLRQSAQSQGEGAGFVGASALIVLAGVFLMRLAVIFSAQS